MLKHTCPICLRLCGNCEQVKHIIMRSNEFATAESKISCIRPDLMDLDKFGLGVGGASFFVLHELSWVKCAM